MKNNNRVKFLSVIAVVASIVLIGTVATTQATTIGTNISTSGNLIIGNGTPTTTLDGEDAYIEGTFEVDGTSRFDGTITAGAITTTSDTTLNAQSDLRLADSDSSNYVAIQAPATISSNVTWTLPSADGSSGQVLSTNGSGTLSWATDAGGAGTPEDYLDNDVDDIDGSKDSITISDQEYTLNSRLASATEVYVIYDPATQLYWTPPICQSSTFGCSGSWSSNGVKYPVANTFCGNLQLDKNQDGVNDTSWRVPTIGELTALRADMKAIMYMPSTYGTAAEASWGSKYFWFPDYGTTAMWSSTADTVQTTKNFTLSNMGILGNSQAPNISLTTSSGDGDSALGVCVHS